MATEPEPARYPQRSYLDDPVRLMAPTQLGPILEINHRVTIRTMVVPWSIEESTGEKRSILVFEVKGKRPGQLLVVFGGVHGDEDTGKESAQGAYETARDELQTGMMFVAPMVNWGATERWVPYGEGGDLNRSFDFPAPSVPLSDIQKHTLGVLRVIERAQEMNEPYDEYSSDAVPKYFQDLQKLGFRSLVIDLHAENGTMIPYVRLDPTMDDELLKYMVYSAELLGIPWVMEEEGDEFYGSLTEYVVRNGMPALTVECGPEGKASDCHVNGVREAIRHMMWHFGMIAKKGKPREEWFSDPAILPMIENIRREGVLQLVDGFCCDKEGERLAIDGELFVELTPGQVVKKGERIGAMYNHKKQFIPVFAERRLMVMSVDSTVQPDGVVFQAAEQVTDERILRLAREAKEQAEHDRRLKEQE